MIGSSSISETTISFFVSGGTEFVRIRQSANPGNVVVRAVTAADRTGLEGTDADRTRHTDFDQMRNDVSSAYRSWVLEGRP